MTLRATPHNGRGKRRRAISKQGIPVAEETRIDDILIATNWHQSHKETISIANERKGDLQWLKTSSLFVPEEYQRPLIEDHARSIARGFDWLIFGVIVTSDRGNGTFAIVDGQNRCRAAQLRGVDEVPSIVHKFTSIQEEAQVFDQLNSQRRAVSVWGKQKSELYQGSLVAEVADNFMRGIGSTSVPLATVRMMAKRFTMELTRLIPLVRDLLIISATPLRQDFLEAICVLEAILGEGASLTDKWRSRVLLHGYDDCLEGMQDYQRRYGGFGNGLKGFKAKADALLYALNTRIIDSYDASSPNRSPRRVPYQVKVRGDHWAQDDRIENISKC